MLCRSVGTTPSPMLWELKTFDIMRVLITGQDVPCRVVGDDESTSWGWSCMISMRSTILELSGYTSFVLEQFGIILHLMICSILYLQFTIWVVCLLVVLVCPPVFDVYWSWTWGWLTEGVVYSLHFGVTYIMIYLVDLFMVSFKGFVRTSTLSSHFHVRLRGCVFTFYFVHKHFYFYCYLYIYFLFNFAHFIYTLVWFLCCVVLFLNF